jgi:hypothetical protein
MSRTIFIIPFCLCLCLLSYVKFSIASGVRTTPQILFHNSSEKSTHVSIVNPSNSPVEVWVDFKYGYSIIDDSGKISVITPDSLQPDDHSAAKWIRAFPDRFLLGPQETQTVRLVVTPPLGIAAGEYWARIIFSSKDQRRPGEKGKSGINSAFELISVTSVPFHYRYQANGTGVRLLGSLAYQATDTNITVTVPLQRTGNASYWGQINCKIFNLAGKQVFADAFRIVVYKDLIYTIHIDRKNLPLGDYTLELGIKTERPDIQKSSLIKSDPVMWTLPLKIQ